MLCFKFIPSFHTILEGKIDKRIPVTIFIEATNELEAFGVLGDILEKYYNIDDLYASYFKIQMYMSLKDATSYLRSELYNNLSLKRFLDIAHPDILILRRVVP